MVIEQAKLSDIEELYSLQLLAFESEAEMIGSRSVPALMESFEQARDDFSQWSVLKAVENGAIIGAVRYRKQGEVVEIGRLMVHPNYRRQGLGKRLISEVELRCNGEILELYTCTKSFTNIRLYEKCGFRAIKEELGADGLSFVYMRKNDVDK